MRSSQSKGVNVLLETEVREIAHTEGEVRCIAGGRTLDYDAVIMTLPSTEILHWCLL